jgi:hypothetical protein
MKLEQYTQIKNNIMVKGAAGREFVKLLNTKIKYLNSLEDETLESCLVATSKHSHLALVQNECLLLKAKYKNVCKKVDSLSILSSDNLNAYMQVCKLIERYKAVKNEKDKLSESLNAISRISVVVASLSNDVPERLSRLSVTLSRLNSSLSCFSQLKLKASSLNKIYLSCLNEDAFSSFDSLNNLLNRKNKAFSELNVLKLSYEKTCSKLVDVDSELSVLKKDLTSCPYCTSSLTDMTREELIKHVH